MKILTAAQTRAADAFTAEAENIPSLTLMERACQAFTNWFEQKFTPDSQSPVIIFCGPGNNGGDGLAIARLLHRINYAVTVYILSATNTYAPDFSHNLERLPESIPKTYLKSEADFPPIPATAIVIDALYGTGLNRPLTGFITSLVAHINKAAATVVAVDMPSGLLADSPNQPTDSIIRARYTVSFELPKLAFLLPGNAPYVGEWTVLPIGLNADSIAQAESQLYFISKDVAEGIFKPRAKYSHKGTFGHALFMSGSFGKMGATVLGAKACLRSGVGLLTVYCPAAGYIILQTAVPEAMTLTDPAANHLSQLPPLETYNAIGIGPGLGKEPATRQVVQQLLQNAGCPLVLDADALNILAEDQDLLTALPSHSILTPHPKEFERLTSKAQNDYHRLDLLRDFCRQHQCYVILKGAHSCLGTPDGTLYFNSTGNPGMATGGTGDVLTGIITGLVAQQYTPLEACMLGVYLHGLAGDIAKTDKGENALLASDIINELGQAFLQISGSK